MPDNKLLVIIVTYNAMPWIERCYDSLRHSLLPCDVITIDNGSTDGTQAYIRNHYPEVDLHEQTHNLGFGMANNIGLQKALNDGYDYAYLLNQDAWIDPDTLSLLTEASEAHPEYGVLSPMQLQANRRKLDNTFAQIVLGYHQRIAPYLVEDAYFGHELRDVYEVSFVMAAHWLITRRCLEQTGGFSPTFFLYGEDDNYLDRVKYWQLRIGIVPHAQAVHDRGNRPEDPAKRRYHNYYVMPLVHLSRPIGYWSLWRCIRKNLSACIANRDSKALNHTLALLKMRSLVSRHRRQSLRPGAFLE